MRKGIYLENTPLDTAIRIWTDRAEAGGLRPLEAELVRVQDSLGRVTAAALMAKISSPFYHASAMDGYAVRFADTFGAAETSPKRLGIPEQAVPVNTGDPLPDGMNAVIMVEDVNLISNEAGEQIEIIGAVPPWQHVRIIGEDIVSTELIVPENHRIRPVDMSALISGGHTVVAVRRRPKVVIIPTGSELVEPGLTLRKGNIIEYNSAMLSGLISEWGGVPVRVSPVPDEPEKIREAIVSGSEQGEIIVVNAGSSAGTADFTAEVIAGLGEVILHGINIKPGKPVILGWVRNRPVLGIPGYPVSAYITFTLFAKSLVYMLQGLAVPKQEYLYARLSRQIASPLGQEEFVRVKLGRVGDRLIATPVSRGAGVLMSLVRADGFLRVPEMSEGIGAGAEVRIEMLRRGDDIENTVVCIGSHDNALDILANVLKKHHPAYSLSSAHVGSMGGLMALKKGEAHMAGTHLLDEETGEYNIPYIRKFLGERKIMLMNLVYRQQGLIVARGNPKKISGFGDLKREDVVFINRQPGAGTRLLTDKHLRDLGISAEDIRGYDREEYTHMGVASAVLTGIADTGLGILASANALGLDFVPVARERYDLAIPAECLGSGPLTALLDIVRTSREFRESVSALGGYDVSDMGKILYES